MLISLKIYSIGWIVCGSVQSLFLAEEEREMVVERESCGGYEKISRVYDKKPLNGVFGAVG